MLAIELEWLQMQSCERTDDLEMAQFFGADVHEEILALGILTVQPLD